jgi:hypothetical protein
MFLDWTLAPKTWRSWSNLRDQKNNLYFNLNDESGAGDVALSIRYFDEPSPPTTGSIRLLLRTPDVYPSASCGTGLVQFDGASQSVSLDRWTSSGDCASSTLWGAVAPGNHTVCGTLYALTQCRTVNVASGQSSEVVLSW